jgi:hypothetical protein
LEAFARALALGLRERGVWLLFRVVAPILGGVFAKRGFVAKLKKSSSQKPILSKWPKVSNLTI